MSPAVPGSAAPSRPVPSAPGKPAEAGASPATSAATSAAAESGSPTTSFARGLLDRFRGARDKSADTTTSAPGSPKVQDAPKGPEQPAKPPASAPAAAAAAKTGSDDAEGDEPTTVSAGDKPLSWRERLGLTPKDEKAEPVDVPPTGPGVPTAAAAAALASVVSTGRRPPATNAAPTAPTTAPGLLARSTAPAPDADERPTSYRNPVTPANPSQGPDTAVIPAVGAGAVAVASPAAVATAQPLVTAKPKVGVARRTRKARLRLSRLDPWSVMKTAFLFSIAAGIMFVVASYGVWAVLNASGLFDSVDNVVKSVVSTPGDTTPFRVEEYINTQKVMGVAALIAVVDVLIFTALATLGSFLYNLAATVLGGLEVTLAED